MAEVQDMVAEAIAVVVEEFTEAVAAAYSVATAKLIALGVGEHDAYPQLRLAPDTGLSG